jgi:FkbM family methyltransferase
MRQAERTLQRQRSDGPVPAGVSTPLGHPTEIFERISKLKWLPIRHWFDLREAMGLRVTVRDPEDGQRYRFTSDSLHSYQRARALFSKEPETIGWLRKNLRPSDVFLDIGANVGTFSIFAARHLSQAGHVYACEPHLPTTIQLLKNISLNGVEDHVSVISLAASGRDGFSPFHYKRWRPGASGSQLAVPGGPSLTRHVGSELKSSMRVDSMIAQGVIRSPDLIKIDTDGIEIQIVAGMKDLLSGQGRPRSVLVEVQQGELQTQRDFMRACGYSLVERHLIGRGKRAFELGRPSEKLTLNAVFEPVH